MRMVKIPQAVSVGFPPRPVDAHKYSVGTVAIVGGSERYPHAPVIVGMGARAAGAGLVQLAVGASSRAAAGAWLPEATFLPSGAGFTWPKADVLVVGNGCGRSGRAAELVRRCWAEWAGPLVLDADALTVLAGWPVNAVREGVAGREVVLTPHEGEAARLLGATREDIAADRRAAALALAARYGATVVLKGPRTLVAAVEGKLYENRAGNPAMALGGMGDLLAGVVGARWARVKGAAFTAAVAATWLHSAAADRVIATGGDPSLANVAAAIGSLRAALENGFKKGRAK